MTQAINLLDLDPDQVLYKSLLLILSKELSSLALKLFFFIEFTNLSIFNIRTKNTSLTVNVILSETCLINNGALQTVVSALFYFILVFLSEIL